MNKMPLWKTILNWALKLLTAGKSAGLFNQDGTFRYGKPQDLNPQMRDKRDRR